MPLFVELHSGSIGPLWRPRLARSLMAALDRGGAEEAIDKLPLVVIVTVGERHRIVGICISHVEEKVRPISVKKCWPWRHRAHRSTRRR